MKSTLSLSFPANLISPDLCMLSPVITFPAPPFHSLLFTLDFLTFVRATLPDKNPWFLLFIP